MARRFLTALSFPQRRSLIFATAFASLRLGVMRLWSITVREGR